MFPDELSERGPGRRKLSDEALRSAAREALEALKPFAKEAERIEIQADPETPFDDDLNADTWLSMGELRKARQAYASLSKALGEENPHA